MSKYNGYRQIVVHFKKKNTLDNNNICKRIIDKLDVEQFILFKVKSMNTKPIVIMMVEKYDNKMNVWEMEDIIYMDASMNAIYIQDLVMSSSCSICNKKYVTKIGALVSPKYKYLFEDEQLSSTDLVDVKIPINCKCED